MKRKPMLESSDVKRMLAAAEDEALKNHWAASIAIVDDGGHLPGFLRMDGAPIVEDDPCMGALGVSGARSADHAQVAQTGLAALGI